MNTCPQYRVRLFLTVDLVGSTAYKSSFLGTRQSGGDQNVGWVSRFRQFYQSFPETLSSAYRNTYSGKEVDGASKDPPPLVWKTIGDEIIFCCRVNSVRHVACCVAAFLAALESYGKSLDTDDVPLDVKGAGWLASFPAENISIAIFNGTVAATKDDEDYLTEDFESDADSMPHKFDFLGTGIDAGFRVSKNAAADRFTSSVGLSYLLAHAAQNNMFSGQFSYHGRERLKGVNRDQPYPVVSIEAERDPDKRRLRARERILTNENYAPPVALFDYLREFMIREGIDFPVLPDYSGSAPPAPPPSYAAFEAAWQVNVKEATVRDESVTESEVTANQAGSEISQEVLSFADASMLSAEVTIDYASVRRRPRRRRNPRNSPEKD